MSSYSSGSCRYVRRQNSTTSLSHNDLEWEYTSLSLKGDEECTDDASYGIRSDEEIPIYDSSICEAIPYSEFHVDPQHCDSSFRTLESDYSGSDDVIEQYDDEYMDQGLYTPQIYTTATGDLLHYGEVTSSASELHGVPILTEAAVRDVETGKKDFCLNWLIRNSSKYLQHDDCILTPSEYECSIESRQVTDMAMLDGSSMVESLYAEPVVGKNDTFDKYRIAYLGKISDEMRRKSKEGPRGEGLMRVLMSHQGQGTHSDTNLQTEYILPERLLIEKDYAHEKPKSTFKTLTNKYIKSLRRDEHTPQERGKHDKERSRSKTRKHDTPSTVSTPSVRPPKEKKKKKKKNSSVPSIMISQTSDTGDASENTNRSGMGPYNTHMLYPYRKPLARRRYSPYRRQNSYRSKAGGGKQNATNGPYSSISGVSASSRGHVSAGNSTPTHTAAGTSSQIPTSETVRESNQTSNTQHTSTPPSLYRDVDRHQKDGRPVSRIPQLIRGRRARKYIPSSSGLTRSSTVTDSVSRRKSSASSQPSPFTDTTVESRSYSDTHTPASAITGNIIDTGTTTSEGPKNKPYTVTPRQNNAFEGRSLFDTESSVIVSRQTTEPQSHQSLPLSYAREEFLNNDDFMELESLSLDSLMLTSICSSADERNTIITGGKGRRQSMSPPPRRPRETQMASDTEQSALNRPKPKPADKVARLPLPIQVLLKNQMAGDRLTAYSKKNVQFSESSLATDIDNGSDGATQTVISKPTLRSEISVTESLPIPKGLMQLGDGGPASGSAPLIRIQPGPPSTSPLANPIRMGVHTEGEGIVQKSPTATRQTLEALNEQGGVNQNILLRIDKTREVSSDKTMLATRAKQRKKLDIGQPSSFPRTNIQVSDSYSHDSFNSDNIPLEGYQQTSQEKREESAVEAASAELSYLSAFEIPKSVLEQSITQVYKSIAEYVKSSLAAEYAQVKESSKFGQPSGDRWGESAVIDQKPVRLHLSTAETHTDLMNEQKTSEDGAIDHIEERYTEQCEEIDDVTLHDDFGKFVCPKSGVLEKNKENTHSTPKTRTSSKLTGCNAVVCRRSEPSPARQRSKSPDKVDTNHYLKSSTESCTRTPPKPKKYHENCLSVSYIGQTEKRHKTRSVERKSSSRQRKESKQSTAQSSQQSTSIDVGTRSTEAVGQYKTYLHFNTTQDLVSADSLKKSISQKSRADSRFKRRVDTAELKRKAKVDYRDVFFKDVTMVYETLGHSYGQDDDGGPEDEAGIENSQVPITVSAVLGRMGDSRSSSVSNSKPKEVTIDTSIRQRHEEVNEKRPTQSKENITELSEDNAETAGTSNTPESSMDDSKSSESFSAQRDARGDISPNIPARVVADNSTQCEMLVSGEVTSPSSDVSSALPGYADYFKAMFTHLSPAQFMGFPLVDLMLDLQALQLVQSQSTESDNSGISDEWREKSFLALKELVELSASARSSRFDTKRSTPEEQGVLTASSVIETELESGNDKYQGSSVGPSFRNEIISPEICDTVTTKASTAKSCVREKSRSKIHSNVTSLPSPDPTSKNSVVTPKLTSAFSMLNGNTDVNAKQAERMAIAEESEPPDGRKLQKLQCCKVNKQPNTDLPKSPLPTARMSSKRLRDKQFWETFKEKSLKTSGKELSIVPSDATDIDSTNVPKSDKINEAKPDSLPHNPTLSASSLESLTQYKEEIADIANVSLSMLNKTCLKSTSAVFVSEFGPSKNTSDTLASERTRESAFSDSKIKNHTESSTSHESSKESLGWRFDAKTMEMLAVSQHSSIQVLDSYLRLYRPYDSDTDITGLVTQKSIALGEKEAQVSLENLHSMDSIDNKNKKFLESGDRAADVVASERLPEQRYIETILTSRDKKTPKSEIITPYPRYLMTERSLDEKQPTTRKPAIESKGVLRATNADRESKDDERDSSPNTHFGKAVENEGASEATTFRRRVQQCSVYAQTSIPSIIYNEAPKSAINETVDPHVESKSDHPLETVSNADNTACSDVPLARSSQPFEPDQDASVPGSTLISVTLLQQKPRQPQVDGEFNRANVTSRAAENLKVVNSYDTDVPVHSRKMQSFSVSSKFLSGLQSDNVCTVSSPTVDTNADCTRSYNLSQATANKAGTIQEEQQSQSRMAKLGLLTTFDMYSSRFKTEEKNVDMSSTTNTKSASRLSKIERRLKNKHELLSSCIGVQSNEFGSFGSDLQTMKLASEAACTDESCSAISGHGKAITDSSSMQTSSARLLSELNRKTEFRHAVIVEKSGPRKGSISSAFEVEHTTSVTRESVPEGKQYIAVLDKSLKSKLCAINAVAHLIKDNTDKIKTADVPCIFVDSRLLPKNGPEIESARPHKRTILYDCKGKSKSRKFRETTHEEIPRARRATSEHPAPYESAIPTMDSRKGRLAERFNLLPGNELGSAGEVVLPNTANSTQQEVFYCPENLGHVSDNSQLPETTVDDGLKSIGYTPRMNYKNRCNAVGMLSDSLAEREIGVCNLPPHPAASEVSKDNSREAGVRMSRQENIVVGKPPFHTPVQITYSRQRLKDLPSEHVLPLETKKHKVKPIPRERSVFKKLVDGLASFAISNLLPSSSSEQPPQVRSNKNSRSKSPGKEEIRKSQSDKRQRPNERDSIKPKPAKKLRFQSQDVVEYYADDIRRSDSRHTGTANARTSFNDDSKRSIKNRFGRSLFPAITVSRMSHEPSVHREYHGDSTGSRQRRCPDDNHHVQRRITSYPLSTDVENVPGTGQQTRRTAFTTVFQKYRSSAS